MKIDVDSRFNTKELDKMGKIDDSLFRDKTFKEIMPDAVSVVKNLKQENKQKAEKKKQKDYD